MLTEERVRQIAYEVVEEELGRPGIGLASAWRVWEAIEALAAAQQRTEEEVRALAEAQRRTEERLERLEATVAALAEAQRHTEERLERLEATVAALAEAQRHTEERLNQLAEAQRRTEEALAQLAQRVDQMGRQLGQLSNRLGLDLEVDAEEVLLSLLEERGIRPLREPFSIEVDGEMDVVVPVELPTGERPWIIVEVKGRLRRRELGNFLQRLQQPWFQERLRQEGIEKPYLPYAFGLRVYTDVDRMAVEAGVGILTFRGERVAPRLWT